MEPWSTVLGRIAYEAYSKSTGGKSLITGDDLPKFEALRTEIQKAWVEAAEAVKNEVKKVFGV